MCQSCQVLYINSIKTMKKGAPMLGKIMTRNVPGAIPYSNLRQNVKSVAVMTAERLTMDKRQIKLWEEYNEASYWTGVLAMICATLLFIASLGYLTGIIH